MHLVDSPLLSSPAAEMYVCVVRHPRPVHAGRTAILSAQLQQSLDTDAEVEQGSDDSDDTPTFGATSD